MSNSNLISELDEIIEDVVKAWGITMDKKSETMDRLYKYVAKEVQAGKLEELKRLKKMNNHYQMDYTYTREPFYVVETSYIEDRIKQLTPSGDEK